MNGSQLNSWRSSHGLTLRQLAADYLDNEVTHVTLSRWETDDDGKKHIPKWAAEKLLSKTELKLSLNELHQLLDISREDNRPFNELLSEAIRGWIQRRHHIRPDEARDIETKLATELREKDIALVAEPVKTYGGGSSSHDTIRHDAMPSRHAAQEHHEP